MSGRKRLAIVVGAVLIAGLLIGAGWIAAIAFVTPAQHAANADAPPPSILTAQVGMGDLTRTASSTASVHYEQSRAAQVSSVAGVPIVTGKYATAGEMVDQCKVLVEVSGRPIIAVQGDFPFYRSMRIGDSGPDVDQLRAALTACGKDVGAGGAVDDELMASIGALYTALGYELATDEVDLPGEMLVVSSATVMVEAVAAVGTTVAEEPAVVVGSGARVLRSEVPQGIAGDLAGVAAEVRVGNDIVAVAGITIVHPSTADSLAVAELTVAENDSEGLAPGAELVVIFTVDVLAEDSLLLPAAAIVSESSERQVVYREVKTGVFEAVQVDELVILDGRAAVAPGGALTEGDRVRVSGP